MVVPILTGGLANCAFQIFATIAYARKHNMSYAIPTHTSNPRWKHYRFGDVHYEDINTAGFYHYKSPDIFYDNRPYDVSYHEIPYHENIILEGHFQSWKYWIDYIDEIRDLFQFVDMNGLFSNYASFHIRRNDYLTMADKLPPVTPEYVLQAINHFYGLGYKYFLGFSDDRKYITDLIASFESQGLLSKDICIEYPPLSSSDVYDLNLMSTCGANILANSSYSLLAYYLNRNPNKQCVAPCIWTGSGYGTVNWADVYPPGALII